MEIEISAIDCHMFIYFLSKNYFLKAAYKMRLNMKSGLQCGLEDIYTKINTLLRTFTASR